MSVAGRQHQRSETVHVLGPGDVACGGRGVRFETLLGSCVAIILTDPRRTVGAICHIVHAGTPPRSGVHSAKETAYAAPALAAMHGCLRARGIEPALCEGWVYGGGNMFPQVVSSASGPHVGERNASWAIAMLTRQGVRLLGHDLGGSCYRRLSWIVGPDDPQLAAVAV